MDHNHCQFLYLQERWLSDTQLDDLGILNDNYLSAGVSGFNCMDDLSGQSVAVRYCDGVIYVPRYLLWLLAA